MKGTLAAVTCLLAGTSALASLLDIGSSGQLPLLGHDEVKADGEAMPLARLDMAALSVSEREAIRSLLSVRLFSTFASRWYGRSIVHLS